MPYDPLSSATEERIRKLSTAIARRQTSLTVVLENIHDPHNVAAVLRSCDAVGIFDVHLIYNGREVFPEFGRKTSGSALKWVEQRNYDSCAECYSALRRRGMNIYTTKLSDNARSVYDVDFCQPTAIVFGNEHDGVSQEATDNADGNVLIPMVGMVQSLNISVACAVTVFEAFRQRQRAGMYEHSTFTEEQKLHTLRDWLQR